MSILNWSLLPILLSGTLGGFATVCGKIAVTKESYFLELTSTICDLVLESDEYCDNFSWIVRITCIIVMFSCKIFVIGYYLKAFETNNTVVVIVMAAASNFLVSGLLGQIVFGELLTVKWYGGSVFIFFGMWFVSMSQGQPPKLKNSQSCDTLNTT